MYKYHKNSNTSASFVLLFLNNREMPWWSSKESNMINGTDGAVFHPLINRSELLYIFAADLCRYACCFLCGDKFVYSEIIAMGRGSQPPVILMFAS